MKPHEAALNLIKSSWTHSQPESFLGCVFPINKTLQLSLLRGSDLDITRIELKPHDFWSNAAGGGPLEFLFRFFGKMSKKLSKMFVFFLVICHDYEM